MRKWGLALLVLLVAAAHQDFWLWTDKRLVFGFIPVGLAYHAGYSVLASITMWVLVRTVWPEDLERATAVSSSSENRP